MFLQYLQLQMADISHQIISCGWKGLVIEGKKNKMATHVEVRVQQIQLQNIVSSITRHLDFRKLQQNPTLRHP